MKRRPNVEVLKALASDYLDPCPNVVYREFEDKEQFGHFDLAEWCIQLSPNIPLVNSPKMKEAVYLQPYTGKGGKLISGEQYFLVLLHEIGHFETGEFGGKGEPNRPKVSHLGDELEAETWGRKEFGKRRIHIRTLMRIDLEYYIKNSRSKDKSQSGGGYWNQLQVRTQLVHRWLFSVLVFRTH